MKEYLKTLAISVGIMVLLYVAFAIMGATLGNTKSDFNSQHLMFIEYIRNLIFSTHDLVPQLTMNYGLGQSFVALYYHGLYNPFVMFSLILGPNVSIKVVMYFIYLMIIIMTSLSMHWLARLNGFTHFQSRIISLLTTFSGILIFHFTWHPMFIYYYPFMILSLVSLHYLVREKNIYFYALTLGMVFYTNFFYAPIVSIIQFTYFIGLLLDEHRRISEYLVNFVKAYLLGLMMGMLFLVCVYGFASQGVRGANPILDDNLFNNFNDTMLNLVNARYITGVGVMPLFATIYALFKSKEKRYFLPTLFLAFTLIFNKLVILLNLGMYHEFKYLICYIPLLWLITGNYLFKERVKWKILLVPILALLLVVIADNGLIDLNRKIILVVEIFFFVMISFNRGNSNLIKFITLFIITITLILNISLVSDEIYWNSSLSGSAKPTKEKLTGIISHKPYRIFEKNENSLEKLSDFNANMYTSLENGNFENMINTYLELEVADFNRYHRNTVFDNYLIRNYLGIQKKDTDVNNDVNPMVYGVSNQDVYSLNSLKTMDKNERLLAINEGVYVENAEKTPKIKNKPKVIYENDKEFSFDNIETKKEIAVPKKYQKDGVFIVSMDAMIPENSKKSESLVINEHINMAMKNDYYGPYPNSKVTFLLDGSEDLEKIKVEVNRKDNEKTPFKYHNLKVEFIENNSIRDNKFKFYAPENFRVKMNHEYRFTINQAEDGLLATTIPYDKGFSILVDGKEKSIEKVNGLFLGTTLDQGKHDIVIKYSIPGFKISFLLSVISLLIIISGGSKYLIRKLTI